MRIARGPASLPACALSEAEAGSNPAAMRTTATLDDSADGGVLNGAKAWISNAGVADVYVVFAVTDRDNARVTAFLVEADREGFSIGGYEHKLGIKGSPTGGATDQAVAYAKERIAFEKPNIDLRGIQFKLAYMESQTAAARALLYAACARPTKTSTRTIWPSSPPWPRSSARTPRCA